MADDVDVRLRGYAELAAGTRKLADNIEQAAGREFGRAAEQVAGRVRSSLPRRTGRTAGSVAVEARGPAASVSMGQGVPYAQFVEYGGRGHPHSAQGNYLYPAAMAGEPLIVAAAQEAASNEIGRMTWPTPSL
jgi:Bacteriophage HK97-gp10, putative tail-component